MEIYIYKIRNSLAFACTMSRIRVIMSTNIVEQKEASKAGGLREPVSPLHLPFEVRRLIFFPDLVDDFLKDGYNFLLGNCLLFKF